MISFKTGSNDDYRLRVNSRMILGQSPKPVDPPLLDDIANVFIAYSTRKLKSDATYSFLCRETTGGTEAYIGWDGDGLASAAEVIAHCGDGAYGGAIAEWYDQSGNGRHAVEAVTANQKIIFLPGAEDIYRQDTGIPEGRAIQNTKHLVDFADLNQPFTVFQQNKAGTFNLGAFACYDNINVWGGLSNLQYRSITAGATLISSQNGGNSNEKVETYLFNGTSSKIRENGVEVASGDAGTNPLEGLMYNGATGKSSYRFIREFILIAADATSDFSVIESNMVAAFIP